MIKNIIFDMGGVLIDFNPRFSLRKFVTDEHDVDLILKEIFRHPDWAKLDRGAITVEEAVESACGRLPERLHGLLRRLLENWADEMPPITEMFPLVKELKINGYGIYLLSNAPLNFHTYRGNIPGVEFFDGFVVSSDWLCVKPEPRIYEVLFEQFSLKPRECFFIDDMAENIAGAAAAGMPGHCFDHGDVNKLREALAAAGIRVSLMQPETV